MSGANTQTMKPPQAKPEEAIKMNPILKHLLLLLASYGMALVVKTISPTSTAKTAKPKAVKKKTRKTWKTAVTAENVAPLSAFDPLSLGATPQTQTSSSTAVSEAELEANLLNGSNPFNSSAQEKQASSEAEVETKPNLLIRMNPFYSSAQGKQASSKAGVETKPSLLNRMNPFYSSKKQQPAKSSATSSKGNVAKAALGAAGLGAVAATSRSNYNPGSWWNKPPTAEDNLESLRQHDTMMGMAGYSNQYDTTSAYSQHNQLALYTPPTLKDVGVDVGSFWGGRTRNGKKPVKKTKRNPIRKKKTRRSG